MYNMNCAGRYKIHKVGFLYVCPRMRKLIVIMIATLYKFEPKNISPLAVQCLNLASFMFTAIKYSQVKRFHFIKVLVHINAFSAPIIDLRP